MDSAFDFRLLPEHLSKKCDPGSFAFTTTDELPELEDVVGQPRAFQALQLGCELKSGGFNIFVLGLPGSGKLTLTRQYLERKAKKQPVHLSSPRARDRDARILEGQCKANLIWETSIDYFAISLIHIISYGGMFS